MNEGLSMLKREETSTAPARRTRKTGHAAGHQMQRDAMSERGSPGGVATNMTIAALAAVIGLGTLVMAMPLAAAESDGSLDSIVRGGRLYDNWYKEINEMVPTKPHPTYPPDKPFADNPAENWRCKECHGWDYRGKDGSFGKGEHFTGIKGIQAMAGADPEKIIAILKNETHGYAGVMEESDFRDLANFVSRGQIDMDRYIDPKTRRAKGYDAKLENYYTTICANCHGMDGLKVRTMPPLGKIANESPWKTLHKIVNGHPAGNMPALRMVGMPVLAGILAYLQTLPQEGEILSSIVRGGRLYDNWYKETKTSPPTTPHPAYPADGKFAQDPAANWRCKECHGWDYLGRDGVFSEGEHFTGTKGIRGMAGADPARIVAVLKADFHSFEGLMDDYDFQDLANFISLGQIDMDKYIDRETRKAKGDNKKEESFYTTVCAGCHGRNGLNVRAVPPLGKFARKNPWEALHKIVNGHPAGNMPALRKLDMQTLVDILAYLQTLPEEVEMESSIVRGGRLYDNWYKEIKAPPPRKSHPLYPPEGRYADFPAINWRCKECHGWDYLGRDGAYFKGKHYTGIKGIRGMAGADPKEIAAVLTDDRHGYGDLLDGHDIQDLANFVSKGQIEMDRFIGRAARVDKEGKARREAYYLTLCANCHGSDGVNIGRTLPLGQLARGNPWEAVHKILNGHPAGQMPALRVLGTDVLVDLLAHIQTLPAE